VKSVNERNPAEMSDHDTPERRSPRAAVLAAAATLVLTAMAPAALAQRAQPAVAADSRAAGLPAPLKEVGFDQRLGERVPLDLAFRDADGEAVRLADYFRGGKPVLLSLVYYECPMLCDLTLSGLAQSLKPLELTAGRDFELVTVSFDPGEGPTEAAEARSRYVPRYGRTEAWEGWHFLTGEPAQIAALAEAVGFRYQYDADRDEYAHAAGLVMLTPDGEVSRYFFGTDHPSKDLRLGLVETADEKIGSPIDQILLYCYHYDPALGRYSAATMNLLRAGGALTVLLLGGFVVVMLRRERRAAAAGSDSSARTA
jgi:protein SCO1